MSCFMTSFNRLLLLPPTTFYEILNGKCLIILFWNNAICLIICFVPLKLRLPHFGFPCRKFTFLTVYHQKILNLLRKTFWYPRMWGISPPLTSSYFLNSSLEGRFSAQIYILRGSMETQLVIKIESILNDKYKNP